MNTLQVIKSDIESNAFKANWIDQSELNEATFKREISFAIQHMTNNKYLLKCDKNSILKSVMNLAQTGLTLNPVLKYAYLVPRKVSGTLECVLDPSYIGLIKLLTDSGSVKSISAQIIYDGDDVEVNLGSNEKLVRHVPYVLRGVDKGNVVAVYSLAKLNDGNNHLEIMSLKDIEEIRDKSEAYKAVVSGKIKSCPWTEYFSEMARKTVVKRQFKYLPKTNEEKFSKAIELDNYANGYDEPIDINLISLIESMLNSSCLTLERKEQIENELPTLQLKSEGLKIIDYLSQNQLDPTKDKANLTTQKEIIKAVEQSEYLDK